MQVARRIARAHALYAKGRYAEAAEKCAAIRRDEALQFDALWLSGLIARRNGQPEMAERLIVEAIRVRPEVAAFAPMSIATDDWLARHETQIRNFLNVSTSDGLVISYPKCGRTWLRFMLGRYLLNGREDDPLAMGRIVRRDPSLPRLRFTHDDRPHHKPSTAIQEDKSVYGNATVLFLVRDPRDVLVSYYFQYTLRGDKDRAGDPGFAGTLSDFIRRDLGGLRSILGFYNAWARNRGVPRRFGIVRYEDMHADARRELRRVIEFFGLPRHGEAAIEDAVAAASFENLQAVERSAASRHGALRSYVPDDPEAAKVRRGVVGGHRDYLSPDDAAYVDELLARELDDLFACYKPGIGPVAGPAAPGA